MLFTALDQLSGAGSARHSFHVLPKLLRFKRTHSANRPIPDGFVPCAELYQKNPVSSKISEDKEFEQGAFDAFQRLLTTCGMEEYRAAKDRAWVTMTDEKQPGITVNPRPGAAYPGCATFFSNSGKCTLKHL